MGKKAKTPKPSTEQKELEQLQIAELRRARQETDQLRAFGDARNRFGRRSLIATSGAGIDSDIRIGAQKLAKPGQIFIDGKTFNNKKDAADFIARRDAPAPKPRSPTQNNLRPGDAGFNPFRGGNAAQRDRSLIRI